MVPQGEALARASGRLDPRPRFVRIIVRVKSGQQRVWGTAVLGVLAFGAASGCSSRLPSTGASSPRVPTPKASALSSSPVALSGFVVLSGGTRLHARPETGSEFVTLPAASGSNPMLRRFVAFEVVGGRGAWVEVRNLSPADWGLHCVPGSALLSRVTLTAWVRRGELIPVLRRPSRSRDASGATLRFAPGVPVDDHAGIVPALSPTREPFPLDPALVGLSYRPSTFSSPVVRVRSPRDRPLKFDGAELHSGQFEGADVHIVDEGRGVWTHGPAVYSVTQRNGSQWVTVGDRCMRLEVADAVTLHDHATTETSGPGASFDTIGGLRPGNESATAFGNPERQRTRIPAGATVHWPDGTVAGTVPQDFEVEGPPEQRGDLACISLMGHWSGTKFCFDPDVLEIDLVPQRGVGPQDTWGSRSMSYG